MQLIPKTLIDVSDIFECNVASPVTRVRTELFDSAGISLSVKREDLIHPEISGNKWRKLKYNLKNAYKENVEYVITFGGAFSNHIYATASACKAIGLKSVGIIRGEYDIHNPTTQFAKKCGMELRFVERNQYREKEHNPVIKSIIQAYGNHILIPEGGSNALAQKGLQDLSNEINELKHNIIMVSAGTGSTAIGIIQNLNPEKKLWIFSSLKSDYLKDIILKETPHDKQHQLTFIDQYHFGGYGKTPKELITSINDFKKETTIPLDPIYNGKLVSGFCDLVHRGLIDNSQSYLWIHTGGLQGIAAYNYMAKKKKKPYLI